MVVVAAIAVATRVAGEALVSAPEAASASGAVVWVVVALVQDAVASAAAVAVLGPAVEIEVDLGTAYAAVVALGAFADSDYLLLAQMSRLAWICAPRRWPP